MIRKITRPIIILIFCLAAYLLAWPVQIDPAAWEAPKNNGYTGQFKPNTRLASLQRIKLPDHTGPEDAAFGPDNRLYITTREGDIITYDPAISRVTRFSKTGGKPLGIEFGNSGKLYVADAFLGLLEISQSGEAIVIANKTDSGSPIRYADDLDIAPDGSVYFTDASTKFGAKQIGSPLQASMLDLMEHRPNGRVLKFNPASGKTKVVLEGLSFANGLAINANGTHFLVVETGNYSVKKVALDGKSEPETIIKNLPGFPDNINRNADGTFWLGLVIPTAIRIYSFDQELFWLWLGAIGEVVRRTMS